MSGKKRTVRVGLIKAVPKKWDVAANWKVFETLTRRAADLGVQFVCTPECFLDGYCTAAKKGFTKSRFRKISQPLDGEYLSRTGALAKELKLHIVFGFTELAENGSCNSAALIDDTGTLLGCYHKIHTLNHDKRYIAGDALNVWDTKHGRIGIMICADRRWPETARTLKIKGAEIIMNPTYGMWHLDNEWWMRTRSYENELFICFTHPNVSLITAPDGTVDAKLQGNVPDVLVHDIDLGRLSNNMFPHRRPDVYEMT